MQLRRGKKKKKNDKELPSFYLASAQESSDALRCMHDTAKSDLENANAHVWRELQVFKGTLGRKTKSA